ncbi:hypothetical protein ACLB2K_018710 [Fragaria x ananassa]
MEFLARSWSLSAMEISKALSHSHVASKSLDQNKSAFSYDGAAETRHSSSMRLSESSLPGGVSPPISPRNSDEMKELFLLHHALHPEFLSTQQQLINNGLYKSMLRGKTMGRWLKDQKEREAGNEKPKCTVACCSFCGWATSERTEISTALASAAALVASRCIEIAEETGANHDHILSVVSSAVNARTNGDIMTLTAGAATALRGAATLKIRLQKEYGGTTFALAEEKCEGKESNSALDFVSRGGELLKRTRKGDLHWKQVSFNTNSNGQVVAKMKSKHMVGTFTKKKKCVVSGVCCDIAAWPGREREDCSKPRAYFGIKTADRTIEFECRSKRDKHMWTEGIQNMLNLIPS